jgi:hypothetical protein
MDRREDTISRTYHFEKEEENNREEENLALLVHCSTAAPASAIPCEFSIYLENLVRWKERVQDSCSKATFIVIGAPVPYTTT